MSSVLRSDRARSISRGCTVRRLSSTLAKGNVTKPRTRRRGSEHFASGQHRGILLASGTTPRVPRARVIEPGSCAGLVSLATPRDARGRQAGSASGGSRYAPNRRYKCNPWHARLVLRLRLASELLSHLLARLALLNIAW